MVDGKVVVGVAMSSARVVERDWRVLLSSLSRAFEAALSACMRA